MITSRKREEIKSRILKGDKFTIGVGKEIVACNPGVEGVPSFHLWILDAQGNKYEYVGMIKEYFATYFQCVNWILKEVPHICSIKYDTLKFIKDK